MSQKIFHVLFILSSCMLVYLCYMPYSIWSHLYESSLEQSQKNNLVKIVSVDVNEKLSDYHFYEKLILKAWGNLEVIENQSKNYLLVFPNKDQSSFVRLVFTESGYAVLANEAGYKKNMITMKYIFFTSLVLVIIFDLIYYFGLKKKKVEQGNIYSS